nr:immunoglobulin heavy chain junction region [Mus musculus]
TVQGGTTVAPSLLT